MVAGGVALFASSTRLLVSLRAPTLRPAPPPTDERSRASPTSAAAATVAPSPPPSLQPPRRAVIVRRSGSPTISGSSRPSSGRSERTSSSRRSKGSSSRRRSPTSRCVRMLCVCVCAFSRLAPNRARSPRAMRCVVSRASRWCARAGRCPSHAARSSAGRCRRPSPPRAPRSSALRALLRPSHAAAGESAPFPRRPVRAGPCMVVCQVRALQTRGFFCRGVVVVSLPRVNAQ